MHCPVSMDLNEYISELDKKEAEAHKATDDDAIAFIQSGTTINHACAALEFFEQDASLKMLYACAESSPKNLGDAAPLFQAFFKYIKEHMDENDLVTNSVFS